jgi:hypothetical protein
VKPAHRNWFLVITGLVCASVIAIWMLFSSGLPSLEPSSLGSHDSKFESSDGAHSSKIPRIVTVEAPDDAKSSFQEFLDQAPNRSIALFVLSWMYGDPAHFRALKERIRLEPEAAVLVAMILRRQNAKAEDYIEFLREGAKAFPDDLPLALCLAGAEASVGWNTKSASVGSETAKRYSAIVAALEQTANLHPEDFGAAERQRSIRTWLAMIGTPDDLVWKKAAQLDAEPQSAIAGLILSSAPAIRSMKEVGSLEAQLQFASDIVKLRVLLNPSEEIFEDPNRSLRDLEMRAMGTLPPETTVGENGLSARQRLLEILNDFAPRDYFIDFHLRPFLDSASPATYMEFQQRREKDSVASALDWVRQQLPETAKVLPIELQGVMSWIRLEGHFDGIPQEKRKDFRQQLEAYFVQQKGSVLQQVSEDMKKETRLSTTTLEAISTAVAEFKQLYR